jgi:carboxyl-terminal processing protease
MAKTVKIARSRNPVGLILCGLGLGIAIGTVLGCQLLGAFSPSDKIPAAAQRSFQVMAEAWNTIQELYVDRQAVKPREMTFGAISGMVDSLGDTGHSRFLTPEMVKRESNINKGQLEGIGAEVRMKNNRLVIVAPLDDSPAQRAGLKPGDIILQVNGEEIADLTLEQAVMRILGPPGTSVKLMIRNPDTGQTREVTLIRARIHVQNLTWHWLPGTEVAHIHISNFSEGMAGDLRKALGKIQEKEGARLVLDLRNSPGGLLKEAIETASQFLQSGNVLLERNAKGTVTPVAVKPGGAAVALPMAVLVNQGTASAPEIVAGALQDHRRGPIIGEKTFGTGTVLEKFPLSDGSALLLAVEEWLTPDGQSIWHRGITPNVVVSLPSDVSPLFPRAEKNMTPAQLKASRDLQLLRAMEMLSALK